MQRSSSAKLNYHFNQKKEKKLILLPARIVMSTQDESGIPFVLSSDQQSFRLLELPPSLIELLTSREPPKYCLIPNVVDYADYSESLSLKSDANSQAVLCTENATFQIRQVHSSNSIFILQSSETQREEHYVPTTSLSAIAQCNASLELTPIPSSTMEYQATKFLREHLPVYKGFVTDLGSETGGEFRDRKSKADMMDDSPFSSGEFDMAWHGMCAFEVGGQAWLPTSSALVSVWRSIVLAAIEGVINLEQRFHITALEKTMDDTGHPWPLSRAVAINLSTHIDRTKDGYLTLNRDKTVLWVGAVCQQWCTEQPHGPPGLAEPDLLKHWQDLLPEGWRKFATLELLKGRLFNTQPFSGRVVLKEDMTDNPMSSLSATASGKPSRRWHDKFRNSRR